MGHLDQQRQHTKGTKLLRHLTEEYTGHDSTETINTLHTDMWDVEEDTRLYSDQTGQFPKYSLGGYQYIMIVYIHRHNLVKSYPLKSRSTDHLLEALKSCHEYMDTHNVAINEHWMENESPKEIQMYNMKKGIQVHLMPPHVHRYNAEERAIRTWKDHCVAGYSSVNKAFPNHLWDRLLYQSDLTLNLLWSSHKQGMSAHELVE